MAITIQRISQDAFPALKLQGPDSLTCISLALSVILSLSCVKDQMQWVVRKTLRRTTKLPKLSLMLRYTSSLGLALPFIDSLFRIHYLWQTHSVQPEVMYKPCYSRHLFSFSPPSNSAIDVESFEADGISTLLYTFNPSQTDDNSSRLLVAVPPTYEKTGTEPKPYSERILQLYNDLPDYLKDRKVTFYMPQLTVVGTKGEQEGLFNQIYRAFKKQPDEDKAYPVRFIDIEDQAPVIEAISNHFCKERENVTCIFYDTTCYINPLNMNGVPSKASNRKMLFFPNIRQESHTSQLSLFTHVKLVQLRNPALTTRIKTLFDSLHQDDQPCIQWYSHQKSSVKLPSAIFKHIKSYSITHAIKHSFFMKPEKL